MHKKYLIDQRTYETLDEVTCLMRDMVNARDIGDRPNILELRQALSQMLDAMAHFGIAPRPALSGPQPPEAA